MPDAETWRKENLRYWPYYGRGLIGLTWESNYRYFGERLGINLIENPDKSLELDVAVQIAVIAMSDGSFTGKKLDDYINNDGVNYLRARRIVNGNDRATEIASSAADYERKMKSGVIPYL